MIGGSFEILCHSLGEKIKKMEFMSPDISNSPINGSKFLIMKLF
jgi:hypothetical protein